MSYQRSSLPALSISLPANYNVYEDMAQRQRDRDEGHGTPVVIDRSVVNGIRSLKNVIAPLFFENIQHILDMVVDSNDASGLQSLHTFANQLRSGSNLTPAQAVMNFVEDIRSNPHASRYLDVMQEVMDMVSRPRVATPPRVWDDSDSESENELEQAYRAPVPVASDQDLEDIYGPGPEVVSEQDLEDIYEDLYGAGPAVSSASAFAIEDEDPVMAVASLPATTSMGRVERAQQVHERVFSAIAPTLIRRCRLGSKRKSARRCKKSLVKGHMLLRNNKGRFCKKSVKKVSKKRSVKKGRSIKL